MSTISRLTTSRCISFKNHLSPRKTGYPLTLISLLTYDIVRLPVVGMVQNELTLSHAARTGMKCPCYEAAPDESGLRCNVAGKRSLQQVRGIDPPLLCSPATSSPGGGVQQTSKCHPIFACN